MPLLIVCRQCERISDSAWWGDSRLLCLACATAYGSGAIPCIITSSIEGTGSTHHLLRVCSDATDAAILLRTDMPHEYPGAVDLGSTDAVDVNDISTITTAQQALIARAMHALRQGTSAADVYALISNELDPYLEQVGLGITPQMLMFDGSSQLLCPSKLTSPRLISMDDLVGMRRICTVHSSPTEIVFLMMPAVFRQDNSMFDVHGFIVYRDGSSQHSTRDAITLAAGGLFQFSHVLSRSVRQLLACSLGLPVLVDPTLLAGMQPANIVFPQGSSQDVVLIQTPLAWLLLHGENDAQLFFLTQPHVPIVIAIKTLTSVVTMFAYGSATEQVLWTDTAIGKIDEITECGASFTHGLDGETLLSSQPALTIPTIPSIYF